MRRELVKLRDDRDSLRGKVHARQGHRDRAKTRADLDAAIERNVALTVETSLTHVLVSQGPWIPLAQVAMRVRHAPSLAGPNQATLLKSIYSIDIFSRRIPGPAVPGVPAVVSACGCLSASPGRVGGRRWRPLSPRLRASSARLWESGFTSVTGYPRAPSPVPGPPPLGLGSGPGQVGRSAPH